MLTDVRVLSHDSLEGRAVGTAGGVKARNYLVRRFSDVGLAPLGDSFIHEFPFRAGRDTTGLSRPANVVGIVRGTRTPGRFIVVTAHYDHVPMRNGQIYNGADDNASGTGAILALAAWLTKNPPLHSVVIAALDGEESGLQGARYFVSSQTVPLDSVILNVNLDMVGRNDANELYVTGTLHYPYLRQYIEQVQPHAQVRLLMGHDNAPPGGRQSDDWTGASDHGAFHAVRIPFLYFGVEDHPDYHRPTDDFERLQPAFYVRAAETVLDVLLLLDADAAAIRARRGG
jgi:Zn-dependent M28 family amino/carboxypeptidase